MANVTAYVVTVWQNLPAETSAVSANNLNHLETGVKNVTDFVNTLNAEAGIYLCGAPFTQALLTKLNGIEAQANKYVLPIAGTNNAIGGVKVDGTTITIDANGVITAISSTTSLDALTDVQITGIQDGEILKWNATAEKWINTSEAEVRTQLSQLTDVDLDDQTLADGQTLRYNETTEKWENGPAGDVLDYDDTLSELGGVPDPVDVGGYSKTVLWFNNWTPAAKSTNNSLLDDISNYDQIVVLSSTADDYAREGQVTSTFFDVEMILDPNVGCIFWSGYLKRYYTITFTNQTFNYTSGSEGESASYNPLIYKIYGIKY